MFRGGLAIALTSMSFLILYGYSEGRATAPVGTFLAEDGEQFRSGSVVPGRATAECSGYQHWSDWLDGNLELEKNLCPEGTSILVWARVINHSDQTLNVGVYVYKNGVPNKCGDNGSVMGWRAKLRPGGRDADWTYIQRGETLTPCALVFHD